MENLGETRVMIVKDMLSKGIEKTLFDIDLINHLNEIPEYQSALNRKLIMIEDEDGFHLMSTKASDETSLHSVIALTYMLEFGKKSIRVIGGGRIQLSKGKFIIYDKSGSFGQMDKKKTEDIMNKFNNPFSISFLYPEIVREKSKEYFYDEIVEDINETLSH